jgi:LysR family glycine cleavage system transcriptional activator
MSPISRVPPLKSIEAFVVAARSLSFTDTASTLNITVPAVSRRIQALESELGRPLFARERRGLSLTDAGKSYFADLEPALDTIRRASHEIRSAVPQHLVRVNLPASLAANWLVPRLPTFYRKHRGIQVELDSSGQRELESAGDDAALANGDADIVIRLGNSSLPGLRSSRLLDPEAFAVCSPAFLSGGQRTDSPEGLAELPLLGLKGQPRLWQEWFQCAGLIESPRISHAFDDVHLLYQAAACDLGVALGVDVLVRPYLESRQLVRAFHAQFKLTDSYYMRWRAAETSRSASLFRDWLIEQGRGNGAGLVTVRQHGRSTRVPRGRVN